jgi:2-C-methyl-D-erythritol 4-phosphate cytidylyltransferase
MQKSIDAIIVAAGSGVRLGADVPKAFVMLCGKPLFVHSLLHFAAHATVGRIILVVPAAMAPEATRIVTGLSLDKEVIVTAGGDLRWQSVRNGVEASSAQWVMIHDAARPFVSAGVIDAVLALEKKFDAVISATPEVDTIRRFSGDRALSTIDRNELVRVQTPQMFKREALLSAFKHAAALSSPPTDEAMLMEAAGVEVGIAWGDPLNFKITTKEDFALAQALCEKRGAASAHK